MRRGPVAETPVSRNWTTSHLVLLILVVALVNVLVVNIVWERTMTGPLAVKLNTATFTRPAQPTEQQEMTETWFKRLVPEPETWTPLRTACRYEECSLVQEMKASSPNKAATWTHRDEQRCSSGMFQPMSSLENDAPKPDVDDLSACSSTKQSDVVAASVPACDPIEGVINMFVRTSASPFHEQVKRIVVNDESYSVGLGVKVRLTQSEQDAQIVLESSENRLKSQDIVETRSGKQCLKQVKITTSPNARAHPNSLYGAIRALIGETIQKFRRPAKVSLAVLIVWAGSKKPPPNQLLDVASTFAKSGDSVHAMLFVEDHPITTEFRKGFKLFIQSQPPFIRDRIHLFDYFDAVSKGNLTHFIHSRADVLLPQIKGHHHYALGWSLCDFRWMFGAIFERFIPQDKFTHFAWGDSDAFPGQMMQSISDYGYDFERSDVISFAAVVVEGKDFASSMMGYTSGTFTALRNNEFGKNLFRYTPPEKLHRAIIRESNGILDEAGSSNAALSVPNVTVALISSQCRKPGSMYESRSNRLFFVARTQDESNDIQKLARLGRVSEPFSTAPLAHGKVLGRFVGGSPLGNQEFYQHDSTLDDVDWYQPPYVSPDQFLNMMSEGTGFATLLRDSKGRWWHRPLSYRLFHKSHAREKSIFWEGRSFISVEMGIVHSRLNGPCATDEQVHQFDHIAMAQAGSKWSKLRCLNKARTCSPFQVFCRKDPVNQKGL